MKIESLDDRRSNKRIAAGFRAKQCQVLGSFFPAHALDSAFKRVIKRNLLEPAQWRWAPIQSYARKFANANPRVLQRRHLLVQAKVKTVGVVVLVNENLRALFG